MGRRPAFQRTCGATGPAQLAGHRVWRSVARARVAAGAAGLDRTGARAGRVHRTAAGKLAAASQLPARTGSAARGGSVGDRPVEPRTFGSMGGISRMAAGPERRSAVRSQPALRPVSTESGDSPADT